MNMPTIEMEKNFATVSTDNMTLWFSYRTLIAFAIDGEKVVSENVWTQTTGKHLNMVDGGNKEKRVKYDVFVEQWKKLTTAKVVPTGLLG